MIQRIRAVYRNGAFIPEENVDFAEDSHVEITVESATEPGEELSEEERQRLTLELLRSMQANPLPLDAPTIIPPTVQDPVERKRRLEDLVARMQAHPLPDDAPKFTREQLHERR